jgi:outer membrane protein assembly factor BamB
MNQLRTRATALGLLAFLLPATVAAVSCSAQPPANPFKEGDTAVVAEDGTRLILKGKVVTLLRAGTEVEVAKTYEDWVAGFVTVGGERQPGWIKVRDLRLPAAPVEGTAGEWTQFHGPGRRNLSPETGLLKQWPPGGPPLVWTAEGIGEGFAGVSVAGGRIYTAGNLGGNTVVTALGLDGKIQWQTPNGEAWTKNYNGARGTPTLDGDRLFHESPHGDVTCMDAASGRILWTGNILREFGSQNITWGLAESVLVDGNKVICTPGGPQTAVVALDKTRGRTVWRSPSADGDLAGYASPTLVEYEGLRMILQMTGKALIGVNADSGDLLFRYRHETRYDVNATTPLFHEGRVFISSGYGSGSELVGLAPAGGRLRAEQVWAYKPLDNHHGGVILLDGYLYGASGAWHCLDWNTGESLYRERGVGKGSLTYADGMLYTLGEDHTMGLVPATPTGHQLAGQFNLPRGGEGKSWAHPVVCGGRLYIRHGNFLYAYDVKAK